MRNSKKAVERKWYLPCLPQWEFALLEKSGMFPFSEESCYKLNKIHLHDLIEIIQIKNITDKSASS